MYVAEEFRRECEKLVKRCAKECGEVTLEIPPEEIGADLSLPCFKFSRNPAEFAARLTECINRRLSADSLVKTAKHAGAYVNFYINHEVYCDRAVREIIKLEKLYGGERRRKGRIVIDFSSPNIAKPFSVGHLRSTVIGQSLYNIFSFLGYRCIGDNHLGDWGTQFGVLIAAYKKWGSKAELKKRPIQHALELYVKFHREMEGKPELAEEAKRWFKKLEEGDREVRKLWKLFVEFSLKEFKKIYAMLNVRFDLTLGESFYHKEAKRLVSELLNCGIAEKSEGAVIIPLEEYNLPPLVIQKSDESTLYATRDLAAIKFRLERFKPEKIIYVVGSEQKLYFKQLFAAVEKIRRRSNLLKLAERCELVHVDFGLVTLGGAKLSTRKGRIVLLEEIINKAVDKALKIIEEKNPALENKEEIARDIGVGSVIFSDLKQDRVHNVDFDFERMLSFEGDTCPRILYAHTRACSILRRAGKKISMKRAFRYESEEEIKLIKKLSEFPLVVKLSAETCKPHHIAQYLLEVVDRFNDFYSRHRVIGSGRENERLALVRATKIVLGNGLKLLNIKPVEVM